MMETELSTDSDTESTASLIVIIPQRTREVVALRLHTRRTIEIYRRSNIRLAKR
jgi:hypothetical protein